jgi:HAD superfamily hydrolase (TIGR01509 family)
MNKFSLKISDFDAILFDLGGVILSIDYQLTSKAFQELGLEDFDELYSQAKQTGLFDRFEVGAISTPAFINQLLPYLPSGVTANQVVHAWNAMLLDFPEHRIQFLRNLKSIKPIYLLSNTNEIHAHVFERRLKSNFDLKMTDLFHEVYYSHLLQKRKPEPETFSYVCELNNLNPARVLFIDDSIQHVEGAKKAGLTAVHLLGKDVTEILNFN